MQKALAFLSRTLPGVAWLIILVFQNAPVGTLVPAGLQVSTPIIIYHLAAPNLDRVRQAACAIGNITGSVVMLVHVERIFFFLIILESTCICQYVNVG